MKVGFISNRPSTFKTCQWLMVLGKAAVQDDPGLIKESFNKKIWIAENGLGQLWALSTIVADENWPEILNPDQKSWSLGNKPILRHMLAPGRCVGKVSDSAYPINEVSLENFDCLVDINAGKLLFYDNKLIQMSMEGFCLELKDKTGFMLPLGTLTEWQSATDGQGALRLLKLLHNLRPTLGYDYTIKTISWSKVQQQFDEALSFESSMFSDPSSKQLSTKWILRGGKVSFPEPPKVIENPPTPEVKPYQELFASDTYNTPYGSAIYVMEEKLKAKLAQEKAVMEAQKAQAPEPANPYKNLFAVPPKPKKKAQWTNPVYYKVE